MNKAALLIIFIITLNACFNKKADYNTIYKYYLKNQTDFIKQIKIDDLLYTCRYKPIEVAIVEKNTKITPQEFKEKWDKTKNYYLFEIKIKNLKSSIRPISLSGNPIDSLQKIQYAYGQISNDFTCYINNIKSEPIYCEFEDTKGVAAVETYNLCFKTYSAQPVQSIRMEYDDHLFKAGLINFTYNQKNISKLPKLSL